MKASERIKAQFDYYVLLTVLYTILMVTAQAIAYRLIKIGPFLEPGGIFIFPATFAVSDIIAEVYGPTLARRSIFIALFAQAFYSIIPLIINSLPHPINWNNSEAYDLVFGSSWLVFLSNLIAVTFGMILNTQIIGKTKLIMRGRLFSLRSLFSSAVGEFLLTAIIVAVALVPVEGIQIGVKLFLNMFIFKLIFSFIIVFPASIIVVLLKKLDNIDVYEENISLNPLSIFIKNSNEQMSNIIDFEKSKKFFLKGSS